jgi:hypothetical protein
MIKSRGQTLDVTDQVNLTVQFKDSNGNPIDTDSYPKISVIQPSGAVLLAPTSVGVSRVSTGLYSYIFTVPYNGPYGVFNDIWVGYVNGFRVETTFSIVVVKTDVPSINSDGYMHLGDNVPFQYSQAAIYNINELLKILKARLNSSGKALAKDNYGNSYYVDCDIFSTDMLVTFLATALMEFNQIPYFTYFTFDDSEFINQFGEILVEYATIYSLASKMIIERGREFQLSDNGLTFTPPTVSELMNTQYGSLLASYDNKIKYIKNSLRPTPKGLGTWSMGGSPQFMRLRHLRARKLY